MSSFFIRPTLCGALLLSLICLAVNGASQSLPASQEQAQELDVRQATVRIFSTVRAPQMFKPWAKAAPEETSGTGFFVTAADGQRLILTNNHVVRWASQIYVQGYQSSDRFRASVVVAAPDFDLALIKIHDEEALADRPTLTFAQEIPTIRDSVSVYGYPTGGQELSITKGIVSRVEVASYDQGALGLRVQVDAAINPGNSGGPAIADDQVVGVAFEAHTDAENIGYLIPASEVLRFLDDVADGDYAGKPFVSFTYQTLKNPALRRSLGLSREQTGVMISHPEVGHPKLPTGTQFRLYDIVTHIGPHSIDNNGQVEINAELRGSFGYYNELLIREDQTIPFTVLRDGKPTEIYEPATNRWPPLLPYLGNGVPSYYIFGPMVFTTATQTYYGVINREYLPFLGLQNSPLVTRAWDRQKFEGEELVCVASPFFPHPIVRDYGDPQLNVVKSVNGTAIHSLKQLIAVLNESEEEFIKFEYAGLIHEYMIFDREEMKESTEEVLNDNGIRYQYSRDLRDVAERYE